MRIQKISLYLLSSLTLLTACGGGSDLTMDLSASIPSSPPVSSTASSELKAALPKILLGLEEIKQDIKSLGSSGAVTSSRSTSSTSKPTSSRSTSKTPTSTSRSSSSTPSKTTSTPSRASSPAPAPKPQQPSGTAELKSILAALNSTPALEAEIEKAEGKIGDPSYPINTVKLKMFTQKPGTVKIDIIFSSKDKSSGTKILYEAGSPKAKVRPGGALSFMTADLEKTDDRLTSTNGFPLDDLDFFGAIKRLSNGYEAELIGKTTMNGKTLHIIKIKTTGTNTMDSRIDYELMGYEPDTYKIRLWELYAGEKEPFLRLTMPKLEFLSSHSDSKAMKL